MTVDGRMKPHSGWLSTLHRLFEGLGVFVCLWLSTWYRGVAFDNSYAIVAIIAALLFALIANTRGLYISWRIKGYLKEWFEIFSVWLIVLCCLFSVAFFLKVSEDYSRIAVGVWMVLVPVLLCLTRFVLRLWLRGLRREGRNTRTVAFYGAGKQAHQVAGIMRSSQWMGFKIAGVYDDRERDLGFQWDEGRCRRVQGRRLQHWKKSAPLKHRGDQKQLLDDINAGKVDAVYITLPMFAEERIMVLLEQLADTTVSYYVVPDSFVFELYSHARWSSIEGVPVIGVSEIPFNGADGVLKHIEDRVLGGVFMLIVLLPCIVIWLLLKLTSPKEPAIFKQNRYGVNGELIEVWKFRSMTTMDNGDTVVQAKAGDKRITRLGGILRKTSLDELPQFWNVLQGRMSIVGPRPHAVAHNEEYRKIIRGYMLRHKVKPGITGWAQVNGWRGETETLDKMEKRIEYDLYYVHNWSLWLDFKIIFLTVFKGFVHKNAR